MVNELLSKIGIGFISNFLLKARVFVLPECVKICCISPSDSEANRDYADAESRFPLFFSLSDSFKNSSPREKVGKLSSFWAWWAESVLTMAKDL